MALGLYLSDDLVQQPLGFQFQRQNVSPDLLQRT